MNAVYSRSAIGILLLTFTAGAIGRELTDGTVLSAENLEVLSKDTIAGHAISSLLTDTQKLMISQYGLKMQLAQPKPLTVAREIIDCTNRYSGGVVFDASTKRVSGFTAGTAFPKIDDGDPDKAVKLIWNQFFLAPALGDSQETSANVGYTINADSGVDRTFQTRSNKIRLDGRWSREPHTLGDGTVHKIQADVFVAPRDAAGLGVFQKSYNDGRPDAIWAYVKSARRIRRLSGGAWMDPVGNLDILNDDNWLLNAYPLWYKEYRYVGKRWILAVAHQPPIPGKDPELRWDFKSAPHWNPKGLVFEPREVHVIEAIPPTEHPYSKKILYMESDPYFPHFYLGEYYDKKMSYGESRTRALGK